MRVQSVHTSKLGGLLVVPGGVALSYASDDFLLKRPPSKFSIHGYAISSQQNEIDDADSTQKY